MEEQATWSELMFLHITYSPSSGCSVDVRPGCQEHRTYDLGQGGRLHFLGDPILPNNEEWIQAIVTKDQQIDLTMMFRLIRGHYYWFLLKDQEVQCGSSFGALFPIHYHVHGRNVDICSSSFFLARHCEAGECDRRYLLERILFNYPFFGHTPWTGITLLPAHSTLVASARGLSVQRNFAIEDHFGDGRRSTAGDLLDLCRFFEEECRLQFPAEPFALSFTGGFDGRTLLAAARKIGRTDLFTYSFGRPGESDLTLPGNQARALKVPYWPIALDEAYVRDHAFRSAVSFMELTDHCGNLGRPHYQYAAELLAKRTRYIVTGNFGSELFRAMHQPGAMMSPSLIHLFGCTDDSWKDHIIEMSGPAFSSEADHVIADLERYLQDMKGASRNQRFYRFVHEEIFRKYFGPELVMQSNYLRDRTPYLSLPFIQALNGTIWSGVHADLFQKSRFKRMKGQVFYCAFLNYADRELYDMPTGKGYRPADVLEPWRSPLLAAKILGKRLMARAEADGNAIDSFLSRHEHDLVRHFHLADQDLIKPVHGDRSDGNIALMSAAAAWSAAKKVVLEQKSADGPPVGAK